MILITGANGYIGQALTNKLYDLGIPCLPTDIRGLTNANVKMDELDVTDAKAWTRYLQAHKEIDTIVHLAAESYIDRCEANHQAALKTNVGSVIHMLNAAADAGVQRIIFPSSFTVYGPDNVEIEESSQLHPKSLYAHMKVWAENLLDHAHASSGLEVTIFRQSNICGVGPVAKPTVVQTLLTRWQAKKPITIFGDGVQMRNFLDLRDCVNAYLLAIRQPVLGTFNLGGPSTLSIADLAKTINRMGQARCGYEVPIDFAEKKRQDIEPQALSWTACGSKLESSYGFQAKYTIEDTIEQMMTQMMGMDAQ